MSQYITAKGELPAGEKLGWVGTNSKVTEIRVVNMLTDIGKLVLHLGDAQIALTPQQWDVVLNCLVDAVGPSRRVNITATTIAERLDAAAKADDNGEQFGRTLNDFIGALGRAK